MKGRIAMALLQRLRRTGIIANGPVGSVTDHLSCPITSAIVDRCPQDWNDNPARHGVASAVRFRSNVLYRHTSHRIAGSTHSPRRIKMASYVRPVPTTDNPSASGKRVVFRLLPAAVVLGAAALLTACGGGEPSGEYIGIEGAVVDKLEFGPDDKVRTTEAGETKEGTFRFEGD